MPRAFFTQVVACNFLLPAPEASMRHAISLGRPDGPRHPPKHRTAWAGSSESRPSCRVTLLRVLDPEGPHNNLFENFRSSFHLSDFLVYRALCRKLGAGKRGLET